VSYIVAAKFGSTVGNGAAAFDETTCASRRRALAQLCNAPARARGALVVASAVH